MEFLFGWIIFSFVVGFVGSGRKIGFFGAFILSLLLSPVIGLIIALISKDEADEAYKEKVLSVQKDQQEALKKISEIDNKKSISIADELEKLKILRDDKLITEDEFQNLKNRLLNSDI